MRGHPELTHSGLMRRFSHAVRSPEPIEDKGTPAYLAEFLGTLVLVLGITGLVSASAVTGLSLTNLALVHALAGLAFLAEAIGAFLIVWAVMGTAVNPTAPKGVAGAAIGGALALGVLIFAPATGASFNPARWFGPALASGTWTDAWMYILAPIVGGIIAALSYRTIMEMSAIPAQTARRGESVEQPPVATG